MAGIACKGERTVTSLNINMLLRSCQINSDQVIPPVANKAAIIQVMTPDLDKDIIFCDYLQIYKYNKVLSLT